MVAKCANILRNVTMILALCGRSVAEISMIQIIPLSRHLDAQLSATSDITYGAYSIHSRLHCRA